MLEFRHTVETAASLKARAERCRALSKAAYLPPAARMLQILALLLDGAAARVKTPPPHPPA